MPSLPTKSFPVLAPIVGPYPEWHRLVEEGVGYVILHVTRRQDLRQHIARWLCPNCRKPSTGVWSPEEVFLVGQLVVETKFTPGGGDSCQGQADRRGIRWLVVCGQCGLEIEVPVDPLNPYPAPATRPRPDADNPDKG